MYYNFALIFIASDEMQTEASRFIAVFQKNLCDKKKICFLFMFFDEEDNKLDDGIR